MWTAPLTYVDDADGERGFIGQGKAILAGPVAGRSATDEIGRD
jgi:hypothetical protein